jgi:VWFA-related protein
MLPGDQLVLLSQGQKSSGNVLILSPNGVFTDNIRRISGKVGLPAGAAFDGKFLWITDILNDKIHRLEVERKVYGSPGYSGVDGVGRSGSGQLEFHGPAGICFNGENIFVADQGNNRIQKLDKNGIFIQEINFISRERTLQQPFGIACDSRYLYVSEPALSRVVQFDVLGNYIKNVSDGLFKTPRHISLTEKYLIVADEKSGIFLLDQEKGQNIQISEYISENGEATKFYRPYSAQMDPLGNLFIVDYAGHTLSQFVPEQFLYSNLEVWVERIYQKKYPEVGVWVSVKDQRGKYLTTLDSSNFTIYENDADAGKLGTEYLKSFSDQVSWVILSPKTATMEKYKDSIIWLSDFILSNLKEKDQVAVWSYGSVFRMDTQWTNSRLKIQQGLNTTSPDTDFLSDDISGLGKALYSSISELLPQKGKRAVIWITEGNIQPENMSDFTFSRLESYARINHIPFLIINFENPDIIDGKNKKTILNEFAEKTGGYYFSTYNSNLNDLEKKLRNMVEERYVLSYQSNGEKSWKGQYMEIKVNVKFQGRNGMETFGYFIE